jgi:hypothetical protein
MIKSLLTRRNRRNLFLNLKMRVMIMKRRMYRNHKKKRNTNTIIIIITIINTVLQGKGKMTKNIMRMDLMILKNMMNKKKNVIKSINTINTTIMINSKLMMRIWLVMIMKRRRKVSINISIRKRRRQNLKVIVPKSQKKRNPKAPSDIIRKDVVTSTVLIILAKSSSCRLKKFKKRIPHATLSR